MPKLQATAIAKDPWDKMEVDPPSRMLATKHHSQRNDCRSRTSNKAVDDNLRVDLRRQSRCDLPAARHGTLAFLLSIVLAGVLSAGVVGSVTAEEATPTAEHGHTTGHANSSPISESPYAAHYDPTEPIRAITPAEIAQIASGQGAGFALPAELNGVPGPRHVLDLADELEVSFDQRTHIQAIYDKMLKTVIPAGQRYLAAEQALEVGLRAGSLTEADLPVLVAKVARLEGELATAHLLAHLETAKALTSEQITEYNRLRGYE